MKLFLKNIFVIVLAICFLISCKKNEPEIIEDPVVYDETGMLGLADSPWPCDGHDSRRTSQSPYTGPSSTDTLMIYDASPGMHLSDAVSPAIDASGNLYCPAWTRVLKFSSNHNFEWEYESGLYLRNIPPISKDGIIYIGGFYQYAVTNFTGGIIIALDKSNNTKWKFAMPDDRDGGILGALAVGSNGTIYAADASDGLFAINKKGKKLWSYQLDRSSYSSPAIAPDGTIYVIDYDDNLYAVKPNGELLWKYSAGKDINYDPIVAIDGTVYIGSENSLLAVGLNGEKQWEYNLPDAAINRPSLANDGTIFIACADKNLYAINTDGSLKWTYNSNGFISSPATIDAAGSIYFGTVSDSSKLIISVSSQGQLIWEFPLRLGHGQPVIDADGTLYIGTADGKIYALVEQEN